MAREVEQGISLTEAYANQRTQLPPLYRALIRVGIASGDLPSVLEEIARHAGERAQLASRLKKALFYPIVSGVSVVAVGLVMFLIIGPKLSELRWNSVLSMTTLPETNSWWHYAPWLALGCFALMVVCGLLFVWFRNPLDAGVGPRGFLFRIPFIGRMRVYAAKAGFAATMALLIQRRIPLGESLELASAATDHPEVAEQIAVMRASAEAGGNLADSVRAGDLISPAMLWLIEAGETSGTVATSLDDVARIYQQRFARSADRLCFFANPAALILVGLVVAGFCFVCLGPMYHSLTMFWSA